MITANKPKDQLVLYTIHESDRGQKVRCTEPKDSLFFGSVVMQRTKRAAIRRVYGKCS